MAKPKFRRLDYGLFEALMRARLSGSTYQVVLTVIDHTIGYRRQTAPISLSRFQDKTSLSRFGVIKAIKQAEARSIITVCRAGINARTPAAYTLNTEYAEWLTGKQVLTSRLVNASRLDQSTGVDQTSQLPTPATPIKSNFKETLKKNQTNENKNDIVTKKGTGEKGFLESKGTSSVLPMRTTWKECIMRFLKEHGASSPTSIAVGLGLPKEKYYMVNLTLTQNKGKVFTNPQRGKWDLL